MGMFLTEQEIVEHLFLYVLTEEAKRAFRKIDDKQDLIGLHATMGKWIRNKYNLWNEQNPIVSKDPKSPNHPDQISMRIIVTIWERMQ
jgi:uncharacterized pyridoxamine 5'-phosphate oxidase family protein